MLIGRSLVSVACLMLCCTACEVISHGRRCSYRFLWVGAHPDDEFYAAAALAARYGLTGKAACHFVIVTRGEAGFNGMNWYLGAKLGEVRTLEARACAERVGATVEFLDFINGPQTLFLPQLVSWDRISLVSKLVNILCELRPHVVLTHGNRGEYGHSEHIVTSEAVSQAIALAAKNATDEVSRGWNTPKFYRLSHQQDTDPVTLKIKHTQYSAELNDTYYAIAEKALAEHKSQGSIKPRRSSKLSLIMLYGKSPSESKRHELRIFDAIA